MANEPGSWDWNWIEEFRMTGPRYPFAACYVSLLHTDLDDLYYLIIYGSIN